MLLIATLCLTLAACSDDSDYTAVLTNLKISPNTSELYVGITQQFTVSGVDQKGNTMSIDSADWSISDESIGSLDKITGLSVNLTAIAEGTLTLTAQTGDFEKSSSLTVEAASNFVPDADAIVDSSLTSQDGNQYPTLGDALSDANGTANDWYTIYVKDGQYYEQNTIGEGSQYIRIIGQSTDNTVIYYNQSTEGQDMKKTGTLIINGSDVTVKNLTIENSYNTREDNDEHQAIALYVNGDRVAFKDINVIGRQDTLMDNCGYDWSSDDLLTKARHYYKNVYVEGTVDFIFGAGTAVFEDSEIHMVYRDNSTGYYTAPATAASMKGLVFNNCNFTADDGITAAYLGRNWHAYDSYTDVSTNTAILNSAIDAEVPADGWKQMSSSYPDFYESDLMVEYNNIGTGAVADPANPGKRKQLTDKQADEYATHVILGDWDYEAQVNASF